MGVVEDILRHHEVNAVGMTLEDDEIAEVAAEIRRLRSALFAIEVHIASAETYDPVIEGICRDALESGIPCSVTT